MSTLSSSALPDGSVVWGDFSFSDADLAELRSALIADCPETHSLTDDDIRQMAYDTIRFVALALAQKQRRAQ